jgi:2-oxoglutarate ferredoxin oxidoreductase subunit gamma
VDAGVEIDEALGSSIRVYRLPIAKTATEVVGKEMTINMVTLGALVAITGIVSEQALEKAALARVPEGTEELNKKALAEGSTLAGSHKHRA